MICITQLLCPQRHCVLAAAWDERENNAQEIEGALMEQFKEAWKKGQLNPYCSVCRSEVFHCETGVTPFSTMTEAEPYIRAVEREQMLVAAALASKCG